MGEYVWLWREKKLLVEFFFSSPDEKAYKVTDDPSILTSFWRPHCDDLVALVQFTETLSEHLDLVRGVGLENSQFVGGLVAVSVHHGPLLGTNEP